jgi:hypothetical protein
VVSAGPGPGGPGQNLSPSTKGSFWIVINQFPRAKGNFQIAIGKFPEFGEYSNGNIPRYLGNIPLGKGIFQPLLD